MFQNSYFNPRSPYGERLQLISCKAIQLRISIHAPLTGSDNGAHPPKIRIYHFNPRSPYGERHTVLIMLYSGWNFNPRSPYGERQLPYRIPDGGLVISIHAPLTGSDRICSPNASNVFYFNPRSPYGERQLSTGCPGVLEIFQSTLPLRGATFLIPREPSHYRISIHAPLTGSDTCPAVAWADGRRFQSTLPLRGATTTPARPMDMFDISIHAPLTGSDNQSGPVYG